MTEVAVRTGDTRGRGLWCCDTWIEGRWISGMVKFASVSGNMIHH